MGMTEESVAELRHAWCLAGTKKNQDVVLAAVLFDSIRGRVNPLCEDRVGLLVGIGAKRLANICACLRKARSRTLEDKEHGLKGTAPVNKTSESIEEAIERHFKEWIRFVPETKGGKSYVKFLSFDMNDVASLARNFNRERADKLPQVRGAGARAVCLWLLPCLASPCRASPRLALPCLASLKAISSPLSLSRLVLHRLYSTRASP